MRITTESDRMIIISGIAGGMLMVINVLLFSGSEQLYTVLNIGGVILILGVPLMYKYSDFKRIRKIEEIFPKYLEDVSENIAAGMTLPQALRSISNIDYGVLSVHVKEISSKVSWGVPFEKIMEEFARKTKSKSMKRNVQTIIETHRSGGSMDTVLRSVAQSLVELERVKKERSASVYSQMINGYIIYVVFLGVMVGLSTILVPAFQFNESSTPELQAAFSEIFQSLIIIQGFFAGLSIGKMAEGTFVAGFKHALVLSIFGYSVFIFAG
jgi:archaeal flagellar protein FlaJ